MAFPLYNICYLKPKYLLTSLPLLAYTATPPKDNVPPPGTIKSILPCMLLSVVKSLEHVGMYNVLLLYSNCAYGCTITINRYVTVYHTCVYILQLPPDQRS